MFRENLLTQDPGEIIDLIRAFLLLKSDRTGDITKRPLPQGEGTRFGLAPLALWERKV